MFGDLKIMLLAGAAAVALIGGTYFLGRSDGAAACDARHAEAAQADFMKRTEEGNLLSAGLEEDLTISRNFYIDLREKVTHEINRNPVYRKCIVPADGVWLVNSAFKGAPAR